MALGFEIEPLIWEEFPYTAIYSSGFPVRSDVSTVLKRKTSFCRTVGICILQNSTSNTMIWGIIISKRTGLRSVVVILASRQTASPDLRFQFDGDLSDILLVHPY